MSKVGFKTYYTMKQSPITVENQLLKAQVGDIKYYSMTVRAFKIAEIEDKAENYGQTAEYKGTADEMQEAFRIDSKQAFKTGEAKSICKNLALIF